MRVLVVQPTGDRMGHYGIYTVKLCHALGRLGHQVTLCTNRIHPERYVDGPVAFTVHEVGGGRLGFDRYERRLSSAPLYYWWGHFRHSLQVASAAMGLCRARPFDVVYLTDVEFLMASLVVQRHRATVPPVVIEVSAANFTFDTYPGPRPRKIYKVFQREVFRRALGREIRAISILGEWHRDRLRRQLRVADDFPIVVIPDGGGDAGAPIDRNAAREKLGIKPRGPVLLFFGMLRRDKGIETLIDALTRVPAGDWHLLIAGFPLDYRADDLESLLVRRGVRDKVILRLEYISEDDVPLYYAASDGVVFPYSGLYTGGSGPLMKGACTYGKAVIATRVAELGRLVEEQRLGLVAPPDDPAALAEKLGEFLEVPDEGRRAMADRALALGRANSWEAMATRFGELFESLANGAGTRR
jgi:glycosyltransferase involved in cell wall biosynthesis